jgi:hypothetical protein
VKNQYFGDINDYRKYGLLRVLTNGGEIRTAICWMLTADDGRGDGGFIDCLEQPVTGMFISGPEGEQTLRLDGVVDWQRAWASAPRARRPPNPPCPDRRQA